MPHIQQLDSHVADLIAAGEVVERPASVVKELMENAIDAGARAVTVEIQHGGMALIRVTDNGCGIAPDEAETAFLRHATSKIRGERDLEAIGTLGFRGEALAAIAAVSRISLLTKTAEAPLGIALTLEGGEITGREEAGCPAGTTMVVRDLFYNTPARLKFVKTDAAEGAAAFAAVQRTALSHPEVSVKFLRDGKQELLTPGDGQLRSAVYSVLGRNIALGLLDVRGSGEEMTVTGFASMPACCRGSRGMQHFFVNGRYVKSRTMMAALEEAYQNQKMVGKFPACVLHLETKLSAVDVNVHPTKQEVKFGNDRKVFDAVYYAVKSSLEESGARPELVIQTPPPAAKKTPPPVKKDPPTPVTTTTVPPVPVGAIHESPVPRPAGRAPAAANEYRADWTTRAIDASRQGEMHQSPLQDGAYPPPKRRAESAMELHDFTAPRAQPVYMPPPKPEQKPIPKPEPPPEPAPEPEIPWRVAGELFHTYILVEQGDKFLLIDKHAAHERMNFDALKAAGYTPMVQALLTPVVFTPPAEEGAALLAHLPLLEEFGFDADGLGGGAILVRQAPDYVDPGEVEATLTELAGRLLRTGRADPEAARDALLHSMACKAAIKGGQKNGGAELRRVAEAVISGQVKYCPHGRPVAIEMTRGQLEKQFKRA